MKTIKILIADDHILVRTGFKKMLNEIPEFKVVGEASNGEEVIKMARDLVPHVVILDIKMPGIDGLGATRKLLRLGLDLKILVVTVCSDDAYPARLLQAGALGYLTKGASVDEMVRAVHTVYTGQRYMSSDIASQLAERHLKGFKESPFEDLSDREMQIALMIVKGIKPMEIGKKLYISSKTVNSYRYRVFEKLNVANDVELTLLAIRYHLVEDLETV